MARFLRRDDPNEKTIRRELLKSDVISNDLIPMMRLLLLQHRSASSGGRLKDTQARKDVELFDIVLRLLVNLTQSALNCFELKMPEDKLQYQMFIEIDTRLKGVKESFANEPFVQLLCDKLNEIKDKEWEDRPEEDDLIMERILFLVRNILLIKPCEQDLESRLDTDLNSHDLLLLFVGLYLLVELFSICKWKSEDFFSLLFDANAGASTKRASWTYSSTCAARTTT